MYYQLAVKNGIAPSEFWRMTVDEFWWWYETIIPESHKKNADLYELLEKAEEQQNNGN